MKKLIAVTVVILLWMTVTVSFSPNYQHVLQRAYEPDMTLGKFLNLEEYKSLPLPLRKKMFNEVMEQVNARKIDGKRFIGH